jgi:hypothetical protein
MPPSRQRSVCERNAWVKVEVYSYPLFICTRPEMLQRAKRA